MATIVIMETGERVTYELPRKYRDRMRCRKGDILVAPAEVFLVNSPIVLGLRSMFVMRRRSDIARQEVSPPVQSASDDPPS